ncbi:MAG: universal stress protein [Thermoplasmatota archaeon]
MMRNLLLATDGTPVSARAEEVALDIAKSYHGKLLALAVVQISSEEERGDQMAVVMEHLNALAQAARAAGVELEARVLKGNPADLIVQTAKERSVDAIVLGTSGRSGLAHALLGSVAEKVVRNADRTVIVAK